MLDARADEQVGGIADDVVLAETAEDRVVATIALDVVVTVGGGLEGRVHVEGLVDALIGDPPSTDPGAAHSIGEQ